MTQAISVEMVLLRPLISSRFLLAVCIYNRRSQELTKFAAILGGCNQVRVVSVMLLCSLAIYCFYFALNMDTKRHSIVAMSWME